MKTIDKRKRTTLAIAIIFSLFATSATTFAVEGDGGKANWEEHCTKCHGDDGSGETKMGLRLKVRDYSDPEVQASFKDELMMKSIKEGSKDEKTGKYAMKPYADKLTEEQIVELIAYTRSLVKKP